MSDKKDPKSDSAVPVAGLTPVRRAPRYGRFILVGVLLGTVLGTVLAWWAGRGNRAADAGSGFLSVFDGQGTAVFLTAFSCAVFGALLGALAAICLDRVRRSKNSSESPVAEQNVTA